MDGPLLEYTFAVDPRYALNLPPERLRELVEHKLMQGLAREIRKRCTLQEVDGPEAVAYVAQVVCMTRADYAAELDTSRRVARERILEELETHFAGFMRDSTPSEPQRQIARKLLEWSAQMLRQIRSETATGPSAPAEDARAEEATEP